MYSAQNKSVVGGSLGTPQERFYKEHFSRLFNLSYSILKSRVEAEEVMHDTLLKYFQSDIEFGSSGERNSWLSRVCVNLSIDQLRKRKREGYRVCYNLYQLLEIERESGELLEDKKGVEGDETSDELLERDLSNEVKVFGFTPKELRKAISKLGAGYRLIITLLYFEGFDYQEVAQITGIKEPTIRTQHARAKIKLAEILKKSKKFRRWKV